MVEKFKSHLNHFSSNSERCLEGDNAQRYEEDYQEDGEEIVEVFWLCFGDQLEVEEAGQDHHHEGGADRPQEPEKTIDIVQKKGQNDDYEVEYQHNNNILFAQLLVVG